MYIKSEKLFSIDYKPKKNYFKNVLIKQKKAITLKIRENW